MLDLEGLTKLLHHLIVEIRTIIGDDLLWDTIPTDDIMLNEPSNNLLGDIRIRCGFNPLGE